ncbi:protein-L-isoaspartate O-methyltransferase family protein [Devosia sp. XGJD_8]|uniref:protein-L-isoaspartate O-methyltransferase family protein n=1 Tax=Devosia sp. XGJD_8 TaxID=3391187 RepID=UPI003984D06A
MVDFDRARQVMIDNQLRAGGVTEARLLSRIRLVPREVFVPQSRRDLAYVDDIQWFGKPGANRFMPAPATLGRLLQLAEIAADDTVLDIGAGTGYATAIMAGMARSVTGLEQDAALAAAAAANLASLGLANASVVTGDITQFGVGRFDVMLAQGMLDSVPDNFIAALKDGGRLVALLRTGTVGIAHVFVKAGGKLTARAEFNAFLPPLQASTRHEEFVF